MTHPENPPVAVHLQSVAAEISLGGPAQPPARRRVRTEFTTVQLDATNPCRPLLPASERRVQAILLVRAGIGAADNTSAYGWLGDSEEQAKLAARTQNAGGYISATSPLPLPPILGQGAVWAALDASATIAMVITVIADYEVE